MEKTIKISKTSQVQAKGTTNGINHGNSIDLQHWRHRRSKYDATINASAIQEVSKIYFYTSVNFNS